MRSPLNTLVVTVAAATLLAGCSALPTAKPTHTPKPTPTATQTVAKGCDELKEIVTAFGTDLNEASTLISQDLPAGAAQVSEIAVDFEASVSAIENEDVREVALEASESVTAFSEVISTMAADPVNANLDDMQAPLEALGTAFSGIGEVCE